MKKIHPVQNSERGLGHIVLIVAVIVVTVVGLGGWYVFQRNDNPPANANTEAIRGALKNVRCEREDKDICRFFTSWEATKYYTATTTVKTGRTTNTTIVKVAGDNVYTRINSELPHESIVIGDAYYIKDTEKNKWYKQQSETDNSNLLNFDETDARNEESPDDPIVYKKAGKEQCGDLTCFKYQLINKADNSIKQYIWFDDQDYQIHKQQVESGTNKATTTFNYDRVSVNEPSPYVELKEGEYYLPGQGVINPSTLPGGLNAEDLNQLLEQ